ncbi:16S rRNA (guanine(966)-N(2))-methyltransferase RsmD [Chlamydiifrater phoenicopteri]|uniref:16S rRNA (guanine(966)-N(2))-methyltransferase RsmD n=1 Tax=Chlamydiifrater phoenicopteri TaxID=2681469 RepID=UPI001BCE0673|nr:16S rRNA (guanine(966)-N(2))-methyltransferase RsmD [Chlamydiifrater phoenicopteri]
MRILSGKFKGKSLVAFKDKSVRPTLGVVKEAVFNICRNHVLNSHFLDVFAGTGSMGFEALSRGAASATFIDSSAKSTKIIRSNSELLQVGAQVLILNREVFAGYKLLQARKRFFHIVYMDPPYSVTDEFMEKVLLELVKANLLEKEAQIFLEKASPKEIIVNGLISKNQRKFGDSFLFEYQVTGAENL